MKDINQYGKFNEKEGRFEFESMRDNLFEFRMEKPVADQDPDIVQQSGEEKVLFFIRF